jgi:hypothetical protein
MNNSLLISSKITQFDSKNFNFESTDKKIIVPKNAVKLKNMGESFINRIQIKNWKRRAAQSIEISKLRGSQKLSELRSYLV